MDFSLSMDWMSYGLMHGICQVFSACSWCVQQSGCIFTDMTSPFGNSYPLIDVSSLTISKTLGRITQLKKWRDTGFIIQKLSGPFRYVSARFFLFCLLSHPLNPRKACPFHSLMLSGFYIRLILSGLSTSFLSPSYILLLFTC